MPADREDRFGVKLHAFDVEFAVPHAHDDAVGCFGGYLKAVGHGGPVDDERVVAGGFERGGESGKYAGALVFDERGFAVHDFGGPDDVAAVDLADALVAEAHAEHRLFASEVGDDVVADARVVGGAGPGADEHGVGVDRDELVEGELVVAVHDGVCPKLAEVLHQVVDKRVVVVDDKNVGHLRGPVCW